MDSFQYEIRHCNAILEQIAHAESTNQIDNLCCLGQYCCSKADYLKSKNEIESYMQIYDDPTSFKVTYESLRTRYADLKEWDTKLVEIEAKLKEKGWEVK